jgi:hypothetical protein
MNKAVSVLIPIKEFCKAGLQGFLNRFFRQVTMLLLLCTVLHADSFPP